MNTHEYPEAGILWNNFYSGIISPDMISKVVMYFFFIIACIGGSWKRAR